MGDLVEIKNYFFLRLIDYCYWSPMIHEEWCSYANTFYLVSQICNSEKEALKNAAFCIKFPTLMWRWFLKVNFLRAVSILSSFHHSFIHSLIHSFIQNDENSWYGVSMFIQSRQAHTFSMEWSINKASLVSTHNAPLCCIWLH